MRQSKAVGRYSCATTAGARRHELEKLRLGLGARDDAVDALREGAFRKLEDERQAERVDRRRDRIGGRQDHAPRRRQARFRQLVVEEDLVGAAHDRSRIVEDRNAPRLGRPGEVVGVIAHRRQIADQEPIELLDALDRVLAEDDRVEALPRRDAHEGADRARARRRVRLGRGVEDAEPLAPRATPPNFHEPHDRQRPHRRHLSAAHG